MKALTSVLVSSLVLGSLAISACGGSSSGNASPDGGSGATGGGGGSGATGGSGGSGGFVGTVDKIDLLFMVDNSISMSDKQALLAEAVPSLIQRLVTPRCLDSGGQPTGQNAPCPSGSEPELKAVEDMHIGVVTSSLGGHGGDVCASGAQGQDDHGRLLPSVRSGLPSFKDLGFLSWDPTNKEGGTTDANQLTTDFTAQVKAAGELGCGYEASLESWYRFLIDPEPPEDVVQNNGLSTPTGVDQTILAQRAAFLRPDSLVAIVMLTDENDCSIRDDEQGWLVSTSGSNIPRATSACQTNPDDPCCFNCGQSAPSGCAPTETDPECQKGPYDKTTEDTPNLRCWEQKRRFGVDWLYPTQRYVDGLTKTQIESRSGQSVPNPLFAGGRDPYLVTLVGIVGVPWQLIATDESQSDPNLLEYKTASQIDWAKITHTGIQPPSDPHMVESPTPRAGLPGPSSAPGADPINGHEWLPHLDDLNFACIFPLPTPRDCAGATGGCDCKQGGDPGYNQNNPLCQAPNGSYGSLQYSAKAYPGLRQLEVLRDLGDRGVAASICAKAVDNPANPIFGYNPAMDALVLQLRHVLK